MYWIYLVTNSHNKKRYVGFTTNIKTRFNAHISCSRHPKTLLHKAIKKYGIENFTVEVLEHGVNDKFGLNIRESFWIERLNPEYNMTLGGDGVLGLTISKETRRKHLLFHKGRKHSKEHVEKQRLSHLGKKRSIESRKRISEARQGYVCSEKHKKILKME